eukprot:TRINITY_DN1045_c0_g1_i1.p1 TRINITY_DN1045_c0_g1~~TRINITY_DN1045_c0_g1_i1.p1  ORF type:complete len:485 (-),score=128.18 TRINITY_DN1045_c0_g1_i1:655-2109(-)
MDPISKNANNLITIIHVDMDAFYAQVEGRRLGIESTAPLCVQQWNGLIAVNYAARKAGVTRFMRISEAKQKCPELVLAPVEIRNNLVSLERYRDASAEVFSVIRRLLANVERASIDEAYIDVTAEVQRRLAAVDPAATGATGSNYADWSWPGTHLKLPDAQHESSPPAASDVVQLVQLHCAAGIAAELRTAILTETGFTSSAGISFNKMFAKIGSAMHKPNQQTVVPANAALALLRDLPLRKIKFLGGKLGKAIEQRLAVSTAGELLPYSKAQLAAHFGDKTAGWLYDVCRGIDRSEVVDREDIASITASRSFGDLHTLADAASWLAALADELVMRLAKLAERDQPPQQAHSQPQPQPQPQAPSQPAADASCQAAAADQAAPGATGPAPTMDTAAAVGPPADPAAEGFQFADYSHSLKSLKKLPRTFTLRYRSKDFRPRSKSCPFPARIDAETIAALATALLKQATDVFPCNNLALSASNFVAW